MLLESKPADLPLHRLITLRNRVSLPVGHIRQIEIIFLRFTASRAQKHQAKEGGKKKFFKVHIAISDIIDFIQSVAAGL